MNTADELILLAAADPAKHIPDQTLDARASQDLSAVLDGRRDHRADVVPTRAGRATRHRVLGSVAACLALAVAVTIGLTHSGSTGPQVVATPRLLTLVSSGTTAPTSLEALAQRVEQLPPTKSGGQTIRYSEWSLNTAVDGQNITSAVVPQDVELRINPDGSAVLRRTTGTPQFPNARAREAYEQAGSPFSDRTTVDVIHFKAGEFLDRYYGQSLSASPPELLRELSVGHPIVENGPGELFATVSDLYHEKHPTSAVRAAILRILADRSDVAFRGEVTDRAGRQGVAVTTTSNDSGLPTRYLLIFDPTTGDLLDSEDILTTSAGKLHVRIPAVLTYTLYRS